MWEADSPEKASAFAALFMIRLLHLVLRAGEAAWSQSPVLAFIYWTCGDFADKLYWKQDTRGSRQIMKTRRVRCPAGVLNRRGTNIMSCDTLCTFLQPIVNLFQGFVNLLYIPFSLINVTPPPVASWFQPFVSCTLT